MLRFTLKIIIFLCLFLFIDRIVGNYIFSLGQSERGNKKFEKLVLNKMDYDIIIFGSSRAEYTIMPSELTNKTKLSAYNLGFAGSDIDFHLQLLKLLIDSDSIPEYIVLVVDDESELKEYKDISFRYDLLYPYANNEKIRSILAERDQINNLLSKLVVTYSARNVLWQCFPSMLLKNNKVNKSELYQHDGFIPLDLKSDSWNEMMYIKDRPSYEKKTESPLLLDKYKLFIKSCSVNNIKLIIVFPPNYEAKSDGFVQRIKELSGDNVQYFDYSSAMDKDKELFHDIYHLNRNGALQLSRRFAKDLNDHLISNR